MVSDRTFGVEIECTYGTLPTKKSDVYERLNWRDRDPMRARAIKELRAHKDFKRWAENIGIDGSGIEIRSPILKGQEGIEELAAFYEYLNSIGSTVTNQDGAHVHHGAADFNEDWRKLYKVCVSWGRWTPVIHSMVAKRRRNAPMCMDVFNNNRVLNQLRDVCLADSSKGAERLAAYNAAIERYYAGKGPWPRRGYPQAHPAGIGGRGAFNTGPLNGEKKTIEIRLAEGLMDADAIVAWVKFGQRFLDYVAETDKEIKASPATLHNLLKKIELDESAVSVLKAKAKNKGNALVKAAPGKVADGVEYNEEDDE